MPSLRTHALGAHRTSRHTHSVFKRGRFHRGRWGKRRRCSHRALALRLRAGQASTTWNCNPTSQLEAMDCFAVRSHRIKHEGMASKSAFSWRTSVLASLVLPVTLHHGCHRGLPRQQAVHALGQCLRTPDTAVDIGIPSTTPRGGVGCSSADQHDPSKSMSHSCLCHITVHSNLTPTATGE